MDNKLRCQSCAMPLSDQFKNFGTTVDGSTMSEYCMFCFKDGTFIIPHLTMEEMMQMSIDNMTKDLKMPMEKAVEFANEVIPMLRRWRKY